MKASLKLLVTLFLFWLSGCEGESSTRSEPLALSVLDLNGDGVADISYEEAGDGYFEFIDRNFDGRVDVSSFYGLDDKIVSSKLDDNFDGFLETKTWYQYGNPTLTAVDENCDGLVDILFLFKHGVIKTSEKFLTSESDSSGDIVKFDYRFGYPVSRAVISSGVGRSVFYERNKERFDVSDFQGCK